MRFRYHQRQRSSAPPIDLNVIPLIDVVFFLLVFYVISTVFMQESGVEIQRPTSTQATTLAQGFVAVAIVKSGAIQVGTQRVAEADVRAAVAAALHASGTKRALVIPDRDVPTGLLLRVMDACTAAGATTVDVAATREGG